MDASSAAQRSRSEYTQRMNRVMDYIDSHLAGKMDLSALASVAHFSPFHFHRLFAAWTGATLGDYVRRRRLDVAALQLAGNSRISVLEVALGVGFGSGEALARAFKLRFGQSPTAWRAATPQRWAAELGAVRKLRQANSNPDQADQAANGHHDDMSDLLPTPYLQVTVTQLPAVHVAYMRHVGPYGLSVNRFWTQTFLPWCHAHGLLPGASCYGLGLDDPHVTASEHCRYDAAVQVPEDFVARSPASMATLPGGRYAVAPFKGTMSQLTVAWTEMMRDWLPASGMQMDGRPLFEHMPPGAFHDTATGVFACELCVPVRPL
jgi:AraC family transcriptional regulator